MDSNHISRKRIKLCRICAGEKLQPVLVLEDMPFTDDFIRKDAIGKEFLADIEISVCESCGSAQNMNDTDMGEYYSGYTYSVQSSPFAIQFMNTLAGRVKKKYFNGIDRPAILEIGSGTGEQLLEFKKEGFEILGVEPSEKLSSYAREIGVPTVTGFFDENTKELFGSGFQQPDAVISSYTFDHIPRPAEVLKNIHALLSENGLVILEVHNLELIRQRNEYCLFEHEHYTYLNERTMRNLLARNNFEVLTYQLLDEKEKRANSLLVVARKMNKNVDGNIDPATEISELKNLADNIHKSIERIDAWLLENRGKKIAAYGAGGRGVMTIASLKHPQNFSYMVDKNPKAPEIFAPKSHLPVYGIEELGNAKVDKILVFSFGYYNEIVQEVCARYGYKPEQFISILDLLEIKYA